MDDPAFNSLVKSIQTVVIPEINQRLTENPDMILYELPKYEFFGWQELALKCLQKILHDYNYQVYPNNDSPQLVLILKS